MSKSGDSLKRISKYILSCVGAMIIASVLSSSSQEVSAGNEANKKIEVYTILSNDPYASDTLKTKVIEKLAENNSKIDAKDVDYTKSHVTVSGLNYNRPGIQAVTLKVDLVQNIDSKKTTNYSTTQTAVINVYQTTAPELKLKKNSIVVNNGDTWNPSSYISSVSDDSGTLPVLKETDNVDMHTDGNYFASYSAIDGEGNSTSALLSITVKTPQEVLDAQAEEQAEAQAQAEAEQKEKEAAAARAKAAATPIDYSKLGSYAGGVQTALSMAGNVPYMWGGTSPSTGFDCSGLVAYSYGLSARTTSQQQALGTHHYDVANAPAGALYFYGSESNPSHVSICIGNGNSVQALNPNLGIQVVNNSGLMPDYYVVIGQ